MFFNKEKKLNNIYKEKIILSDNIEKVTIIIPNKDININKSSTNNIHISYYENEFSKFNIIENKTELFIENKVQNAKKINLNNLIAKNKDTISIKLPNKEFSLQLKTINGDVYINLDSAKNMTFDTINSDIRGQVLSTKNITAKSVSGDFEFLHTNCQENLIIETVNGDIETKKCDAKYSHFKTVNGDFKLNFINEKSHYNIKCKQLINTNYLDNNSDKNINIDTVNGDINLSFQ